MLNDRTSSPLLWLARASTPLNVALCLLAGVCWTATSAQEPSQATPRALSVGFTEDGHPFIGKPDAPVTLEEWSDYLCPYCGRHFRQTFPDLLDRYVSTGKMKLVFRDLPLASLHPTAAQGHVAARCAGEQSAAWYWDMHDALFSRQAEWNRLPDPGDFLAGVVEQLGADMDEYAACIADGAQASLVAASVEEGRGLGYHGTPSFRFRSAASEETYSLSGAMPLGRFAGIADALIAGEAPPEAPAPKPAELPLWANPEGLAPDPERPGFTVAGDAYKGNPEATMVVVEFNDFQCPACQKHALEVQPLIDKELVDTGKVLWVDKHLPLRMHEHAAVAAVAAECAGDQQKYWQMHRLLHEKSDDWADKGADEALLALAEGLGLDMPAFRACFQGRSGLERVLGDIYDAQGVIRQAPTFVILQDGRGVTTGPLPGEQFVKLLSGRLKAAEETVADPEPPGTGRSD